MFLTWIFLTGGDGLLEMPATISFGEIQDPSGSGETGPVPFRTIVMLIALISQVIISLLAHYLFTKEKMDLKFDFFGCFKQA